MSGRQIKRQRRGKSIPAKRLNQLIDARNVDNSYTRRPQQLGGAGVKSAISVRRLEIRALADDYLECVEPDTVDSPIYYVAKPLGVRMSRASHGDLTFTYADSNTRTATSDDTTEAQTLVEPYVVADQLFAATPIAGGVGVVKDGAELVWQEMLNTPRWWAVAD